MPFVQECTFKMVCNALHTNLLVSEVDAVLANLKRGRAGVQRVAHCPICCALQEG